MYILDTNTLITYSKNYPQDIDKSKWEFIDSLIKKGKIISNEKVKIEISKYEGHDYLRDVFIKKYKGIFLPINKIENWSYNTLKEIIELDQNKHLGLIKQQDKYFGDPADPYILCQAKCSSKGKLITNTVVTSDKALINACRYYQIDVIEPLDLFRRENKKF